MLLTVDRIQDLITFILKTNEGITEEVVPVIEVLNVFNKANQKREAKEQISYRYFHNDEINRQE